MSSKQTAYPRTVYTRVYQRLCRERGVPDRGVPGSPQNKVRQSMLSKIHFETMRLLDRGVTE